MEDSKLSIENRQNIINIRKNFDDFKTEIKDEISDIKETVKDIKDNLMNRPTWIITIIMAGLSSITIASITWSSTILSLIEKSK